MQPLQDPRPNPSWLPAEIRAFRDSEEVRLLPIMKAAGIKPE